MDSEVHLMSVDPPMVFLCCNIRQTIMDWHVAGREEWYPTCWIYFVLNLGNTNPLQTEELIKTLVTEFIKAGRKKIRHEKCERWPSGTGEYYVNPWDWEMDVFCWIVITLCTESLHYAAGEIVPETFPLHVKGVFTTAPFTSSFGDTHQSWPTEPTSS